MKLPRQVLTELGITQQATVIRKDNNSGIEWAKAGHAGLLFKK